MRTDPHSKRFLLGLSAGLVILGVLVIATPFVVHAMTANAGVQAQSNVPLQGPSVRSVVPTAPVRVATEASAVPTISASVASSTVSTIAALAAKTPTVTAAVVPTAPAGPSTAAYKGLGSWVDIYDDKAWANPSAAVADMASHGVRTLYLETSNSRSSFALKSPSAMAAFIKTAHVHGMSVVAWYLPDMTSASTDYDRIAKAIAYSTPDGQKFDSFALDIESGAVKSQSARNAALESLSTKIRSLVGASYPLGAIIPSPTGLAKKGSYWSAFPYTMLAGKYDAFVPMSYYTYHGKGASAASADTLSNVRILHAQKGCSAVPIHLIGGIAENSTTAEVQAFVKASVDSHVAGASLYSWPGTTAGDWKALSVIKP